MVEYFGVNDGKIKLNYNVFSKIGNIVKLVYDDVEIFKGKVSFDYEFFPDVFIPSGKFIRMYILINDSWLFYEKKVYLNKKIDNNKLYSYFDNFKNMVIEVIR